MFYDCLLFIMCKLKVLWKDSWLINNLNSQKIMALGCLHLLNLLCWSELKFEMNDNNNVEMNSERYIRYSEYFDLDKKRVNMWNKKNDLKKVL